MKRRHRPQVWLVTADRNGSFSVWHGNRPVATAMQSQWHALDMVRRAHTPGEKVYLDEDDGARHDLTKQFPAPEATTAPSGPVVARESLQRYLNRYGRLPGRR